MASCAVGSVRGFDQLAPEHLNIVSEQRKYSFPGNLEPIELLKRTLYKQRENGTMAMAMAIRDVQAEERDGLYYH